MKAYLISKMALATAALVVLGGAVDAHAQASVIRIHPGPGYINNRLSVAAMGDYDGDGLTEYGIATLPFNGSTASTLTIHDGATGVAVVSGFVDSYTSRIEHLVPLGDIDGDAISDFAVSNSDANGSRGRVAVRSGADLSLLYSYEGAASGDGLGQGLDDAGDVDGDGVDDIVAGEPYHDGPIDANMGRIWVYSGATGAVLHLIDGGPGGTSFGEVVAGVGDVNNDGFADFAAGARQAVGYAGRVRVFSGADGSILHEWIGDNPSQVFGTCIDGIGDANGDGYGEVVVGSFNYGITKVFSGADGSELYLYGSQGWGCRGIEDVSGDGVADFVTWVEQEPAYPSVSIYSGASGLLLATLVFQPESSTTVSDLSGVDTLGDVNKDRHIDLIVGLPEINATRVLSLFTPCSDVDGDGFAPEGGACGVPADCDDVRDYNFPGANEICDTLDNNCDGQVDEDADGDGYDPCGGDCDELDPLIHPYTVEIPGNAIDENCNGSLSCGTVPSPLGGSLNAATAASIGLSFLAFATLAIRRRRR
ncbi:MAG: FG-GAP repeat protein [Myxococcales bacterium]|nr:FG-GAP repeat protein [Myxococcales bacterium]